ncbi:MAG: GNAT family N-acetyltransferase [Gammaproteobacteria bacterium]|nr:GNAT family N-acetyltransferase [Gammaproteobacteria bacterium]
MIEKSVLSPAQSKLIQERLSLSEHRNDLGPPQVWAAYESGLFALFEETSGRLVALVEASGLNDVQPGWWIDSAFRGRGYGKKVIDILAQHLKARGVTRIGPIAITTHQQQYDKQSSKLAQRLRSYFE